jgi:sulfite exporter TauE/SafE
MTPLLPCGLLYGVFATAFAAASFAGGALTLACFAAGGLPALALAQLPARWRSRPGGAGAWIVRRVVPLVAAGVVAYRAVAVSHGAHCH